MAPVKGALSLTLLRERQGDIEVDTTDLVLSSLLNWLPICNDKVWRILQKPRTPSNYSSAAD